MKCGGRGVPGGTVPIMAAVSETGAHRLPSRSGGGRSAPPPSRLLTEEELRALVTHGTANDVADVLLSLTEPERRALATPVRRLGAADEAALLVAGAACLTRASSIVSWLRSRRFRQPASESTIEEIVRVLSAPGRPDLAAVADGLVSRLRARPGRRDEWAIAAAVLRAAGIPPPVTDVVVRAWVREHATADQLAADPWLDLLLPYVLESPDIFAMLDRRWAAALVRLAASGRTSRAALIRLALREMHGGGLRAAMALYRLLDPGPDETAAHVADYLSLLGGSHAVAASLAQGALRTLDEAGRVDSAVVAAAGCAALRRTEKKLVRGQLAWLARAVARRPSEAGVLLAAVAVGLSNPSADIADRSLALLARHPAGLEVLRDVAGTLSGDLRRRAQELLGMPDEPLELPPGDPHPGDPERPAPSPARQQEQSHPAPHPEWHRGPPRSRARRRRRSVKRHQQDKP